MKPGCSPFTRMPDGPSSRASVFVTVHNAPLDAAYAPCVALIHIELCVLIMITRPSPRACMCGTAARVMLSVPKKLTSMARRNGSRSAVSTGSQVTGSSEGSQS